MSSGVNLGPLTTPWTAASSCLLPNMAQKAFEGTTEDATATFGRSCSYSYTSSCATNTSPSSSSSSCFLVYGYQYLPAADTNCWPPRAATVASTGQDLVEAGWGFYSPGLVCPAGYVSACSATAGGSSDWQPQWSLTSGETAVGCCPSSYLCSATTSIFMQLQTCVHTATSTSYIGELCQGSSSTSYAVFSVPTTYFANQGGGVNDSEVFSTNTMFAPPMFQLKWREVDRSVQTSSTHSSTPPPTPPPPAPTGLSVGAKAGIGVSVSIAGLAAVGGLLWWIMRHRRNAAERMQPPMPESSELQGQGRYEIPGQQSYAPHELDNGWMVQRGGADTAQHDTIENMATTSA